MEYIRNINVKYKGNRIVVAFDDRPEIVYTVGPAESQQSFAENMNALMSRINRFYPMTKDTECEVISRVQDWVYHHSADSMPATCDPLGDETDIWTSILDLNQRWTDSVNARSAARKESRRRWYHAHFGPVARRRIKIGAIVGALLLALTLILSYWMILVAILGVTIVLGLAMAS